MQPAYVAFDVALAALSARSIVVLRTAAPWTSAGWVGVIGYCAAAIVEFSRADWHRPAALVAYLFVVLLAVAFALGGIRDEPQAEPWWWPTRLGPTRKMRREGTGRP